MKALWLAVTLLLTTWTQDVVRTDAPRRPLGAPTRLGQELLRRCDLVGIVRADSVQAVGKGVVLVHYRLLEKITGRSAQPERGDRIVVLAFAGRFETGGDDLVYLRRYRDGKRFELLYRVDADDRLFERKVDVTRQTVGFVAIGRPQLRAQAVLEWLAKQVESDDDWRPSYALDELRYLAAQQSWVFDDESVARLRVAARRARDPAVQDGVESVASSVERGLLRLLQGSEKGTSPP